MCYAGSGDGENAIQSLLPVEIFALLLDRIQFEWYVGRLNGEKERGICELVLLGSAFAVLPFFFVGAGQKMHPNVALTKHGMPAYPVYPETQLSHSMLDEQLLVSVRDLFVGQRWQRYGHELLLQPRVQPVELFVSSRHLNVVERRRQLVGNVAFQALQFGLFLERRNRAAVLLLYGRPHDSTVRILNDVDHVNAGNMLVFVAQNVVLAAALHEGREAIVGFANRHGFVVCAGVRM